jgi:hypothetical protein
MIYLICQDWSNTSNNHAGIKYLCNQIQEMYPESYKTFVIPAFWNDRSKSPIRIIASLQYLEFVLYDAKFLVLRI